MKSNADTSSLLESQVEQLYRHRFPAEMLASRAAVWKVLCESWFSRYVEPGARVLEVAAGYCEFINNIRAAERVAVDLNPSTARHAADGVTVYELAAERVAEALPHDHFDAVFMSNFLEHCRSREQVLDVLRAVRKVLKPGGRVLILGPNFRYCHGEYFDYFDHHLPLTEKSVSEALGLTDFRVDVLEPRTLPFTFRSRLPASPLLVRLYLRFPLAWRFFGAQFFVVGSKAA